MSRGAIIALMALLAWPAGAARRESLTSSRFHLDPGEWRYFEVPVKEGNARLDVEFEVTSPKKAGGIRVRIFRDEEFQRFRSRQQHRTIGATGYDREGRWRARLADAGVYIVVVDNGAGERQKAQVRMDISLMTGPEPENLPVTYASPRKKQIVVTTSIAGFLVIVVLWGKALWRAARNRPDPPLPPPTPVWY